MQMEMSTKAIGLITRPMEKDLTITKMVPNTKAIGNLINKAVTESKPGLMALNMRVSMLMARNMERAPSLGLTVQVTRAASRRIISMVMVFTCGPMEEHLMEIGLIMS